VIAVAKSSTGESVLIPESDAMTWQVQGDIAKETSQSRIGVDKYHCAVVGTAKGTGTITCTLKEGIGSNSTKTATLQDIPVVKWIVPSDSGDGSGPRRVGYDPLLAIGAGWDSRISNGTCQKKSPLQGNPDELPISVRIPSGGVTTTKYGWDQEIVTTESGQYLSIELKARYAAYATRVETEWDKQVKETSNKLCIDYIVKKDFGEYWLNSERVRLDADAAALLASNYNDFKTLYGDQVIIGGQRQHYVIVRFTSSNYSRDENESFGITADASGSWGTGKASLKVDFNTFVTNQIKRFGGSLDIISTVGDVPGLVRATLSVNPNFNGIADGLAKANEMVSNSNVDSYGGAQMTDFTAAPIGYLCGAVPIVITSVGGGLEEYMRAYTSQRRALANLESMVENPTKYAYLPTSRYNECINARPIIQANIDNILVPGLKTILGGGTAPPLEDKEKYPFGKHPYPRITPVFGEYSMNGEAFTLYYMLELRDIKSFPDTQYWMTYFNVSPNTSTGWLAEKVQSNGVVKYCFKTSANGLMSAQWGAIRYQLLSGVLGFSIKDPTTDQIIIEKRVPMSAGAVNPSIPPNNTWWNSDVPY